MTTLTRLVLLSTALLFPSSDPGAQQLDPNGFVDQAWMLLPEYGGEHRWFLNETEAAQARAAAHLLEAAIALEPDHVRALWSLGHAQALLSEDQRNRSNPSASRLHTERALWSLGRAIEIQPDDPWALYSRGVERSASGDHAGGLEDMERAVAAVEKRRSEGDTQLDWLRFKILGWRAELLMRAGAYEKARARFREYHAEFSNNDWPLLIALGESHLRERDLAGARAQYVEAIERFSSDHQAYALLGYVDGLLGDNAGATLRLEQAIEREREPGMYTRLWLAILAVEGARDAALDDLREFLENPPPALSDWDRSLGLFFLGSEDPDAFAIRLEAEKQRRFEAASALDDLECEAWFYIGLRQEMDAADAEAPARRALGEAALDSYRRALSFAPRGWKWEWAFARMRFADLARSLGKPASGFGVPNAQGASNPLPPPDSPDWLWHAPRSPRPISELDREPRPGDLAIARLTSLAVDASD